ncbi:MAG: PEGA domain-containing protein, partial [Acidobacteriota bacterium]
MKHRILYLLCALALYGSMMPAQINRQMKVESIEESTKINPEPERSLVIVRSQIPNLKFESNRNIDRVNEVSSGYWEVWLPAGTHLLKIDAAGYERLELPPKNFARKRTYEMRIIAVGYVPASRADENLIEVVFRLNRDSVASSYGEFAPIVSRSRVITYKVPKGEYTFTFRKEGCRDEKRTLNVTSPVTQNVELSAGASSATFRLPGIVHITSEPSGAEIVLNGQRIGTTPYQGDISAGTHQLELRKVLHYPTIAEFSLREGEAKSLSLSLKPRFGYLSVRTDPSGARIMIDGKDAGLSPVTRRECETG